MSYSFKLPYGLRKYGNLEELVHISEIKPYESGLKCNCICPKCGERLQAKLPKTKVDFTPRFAHHNSDTCEHATETAIHMKAKEIIEREKEMVIPSVVAYYEFESKEVSPEKKVIFDRVILEHRLKNVIPDILAYKNDRPLMIEITITHGIDDAKFKKIENLGISTLEIDFSDLDTNFDPDFLYEQIILKTSRKYWVYNANAEKEKDSLKLKYLEKIRKIEEEERIAEEKRLKKERADEEKKKSKAIRVTKLLDKNHQEQLKKKWNREFHKDPIWIKASKGMNILSSNVPEHLNIEIPGEIVFGCDRRVWQAYIFYRYINDKVKRFRDKTFPISVKRIQETIKEDFRNRLIYDLVYLKDLQGYEDIPDLAQVIYTYLKKLEEYGYLAEQKAGHIYHTKFIILEPDSVYEMRFLPTSMPEYKKIEYLMKKNEWIECRKLVQELLVKYNQTNEVRYFEALASIYDTIVLKYGGSLELIISKQ